MGGPGLFLGGGGAQLPGSLVKPGVCSKGALGHRVSSTTMACKEP